MALTAKEKAMIDAIVENQLRLEAMIANRAHPLAGLGVRIMRDDPFDSPLIISAAEHKSISRKAASLGKRAGKRKKRQVSAYQREFGRQFKKLKKKHPRTNVSTLMKKAHRATKKVRRK